MFSRNQRHRQVSNSGARGSVAYHQASARIRGISEENQSHGMPASASNGMKKASGEQRRRAASII